MKRAEIFGLINKEREYQDSRFGTTFDELNTLGEWIIYIEEYLQQAKKKFFGARIAGGVESLQYIEQHSESKIINAVKAHQTHYEEVTKKVIKIATLCVACLEYFGVQREQKKLDEETIKIYLKKRLEILYELVQTKIGKEKLIDYEDEIRIIKAILEIVG